MRIANIDSNLSYAIAPHADYGAIALEFQRNVGGASAADAAAPWEPWRLTGLFAMASVEDDPQTDGVEIGQGIGAWDYAFSHYSGQIYYVGSFHGGETVTSYSGTDLTQSGYVTSFSFDQQTHLVAGSGRQIDVSHQFALSAGGVVTQALEATSTDSFGTRTLGMLILDPNFTDYSIDDGANYTTLPNDDSVVDLGDAADLLLRNPVTGHTIRQVTDAMDDPQFTRISGRRRGADTKTYIEFDTDGVIGTISATRTLTFGATEPDPAPEWEPYTIDFTQATPGNANLPLGVTREGSPPVPAPATLDTGAGEFTIGGGSGTNRWVVTDPAKVLPPGEYTLEIDYRTSTSNNTGQSQVAGVATGSIVTDQILTAQSFNAPAGATQSRSFTVPAGKVGYVAWQSTTNTDGRTLTLTEIRVTGTPA